MFTTARAARRWHPPRLLLAGIIVLAALASGYGLSLVRAVPPGPGEVLMCVSLYTGTPRIVNDTDQCGAGHKLVVVNQQGPAGPQGPQGDQGPPGADGADGADGAPGITSTIIRLQTDDEIAPGNVHQTTASCEDGEVATGGSYFSTSISTVFPRAIFPGPGGENSQPTDWTVIWVNTTAVDGVGGVYVICAPQ